MAILPLAPKPQWPAGAPAGRRVLFAFADWSPLLGTPIIEIGWELIAAKAECGHGKWLGWLETEFGWHENTARNYMNVAATFGKSTTVVDLPSPAIDTAALYALASPRVPQIVRDEAVDRAEAGERITKAEAQDMIRKALGAEAARNQDLVQQAEAKAADVLRQAAAREREAARNPDLTISSNMDAEAPAASMLADLAPHPTP
jgi:hypothetical protein